MPNIHILTLLTARTPWFLAGQVWARIFEDPDTGAYFALIGPKVPAS